MPIRITGPTGTVTKDYESPFVGPVDHTAPVSVDVSSLTNKEVDTKGYLKPGVPFDRDGALITYGGALYGVTVEEVKVADGNEAADFSGAVTPQTVAVGTIGQINRAVAEDMLERAYSGDELAAFEVSNITLIY